jgi:hypothetical protein
MNTTYLNRYITGEYMAVWQEISPIADISVIPNEVKRDVLPVIDETMKRVKANIEQLVQELTVMGFSFGEGFLDEVSEEERKEIYKESELGWSRNNAALIFLYNEANKR